MEDGKKIPEKVDNEFPMNRVFLFIAAWILSLGGMYLYMTVKYKHELNIKSNEKSCAVENAKHKFRSSIWDAPIISNSLIATTCLKFEVIDTFFAKGTYFRNFVEGLVPEEGLEKAWLRNAPLVNIEINGGVEGVHVSFHMMRPSFLQYYDSKQTLHQDDIYFQSYISCAWQEKSFPPGTRSEEVAAWLELQTRALCRAAKVKNKEVLDKVNEKLEKRSEEVAF